MSGPNQLAHLLGRALARARVAAGMTQLKVSLDLKIALRAITYHEGGGTPGGANCVTLTGLQAYADHYDVTPKALLLDAALEGEDWG